MRSATGTEEMEALADLLAASSLQVREADTVEIRERRTTLVALEQEDEPEEARADERPRAYQSDPAVVAAAAAAAAVKFRSNYLPPIGVFWDIENCQVRATSLFWKAARSRRVHSAAAGRLVWGL